MIYNTYSRTATDASSGTERLLSYFAEGYPTPVRRKYSEIHLLVKLSRSHRRKSRKGKKK